MRKLTTILALSLVSIFSYGNEVKSESKAESEDAIYCKVTRPDGTTIECFLCNCKNLEKVDSIE